MRRIALVINPNAGRGDGWRLGLSILDRLRAHGLRVSAEFTRSARHGAELVEAALRSGTREVVVAGGDGTVFDGFNGYLAAGVPDTTLGVVPVGTGNDFVKMLGVPADWRSACDRIAHGEVRTVDAGRCNGVYFANGIGMGLDASVALEANRIRWLRGDPVYILALARTLMHHVTRCAAEIEFDGQRLDTDLTMVAIANGSTYGGSFRVAPQADIGDGLLELMIAQGMSRPGILALVPRVMLGRHLGHPKVMAHRVRSVGIRTALPMVVHADGEIIDSGCTAIDVQVLAGAVKLRG